MRKRNPHERFWEKVDTSGECWLWTAYLDYKGYGRLHVGDKVILAHRWAYEALVGPIPEGLTVDHLCRVRRCVNPYHLEAVSATENVMRGESLPAQNARKTHCKRGHEFTPENTYSVGEKGRGCRTCLVELKSWYQRKKSPATITSAGRAAWAWAVVTGK